MSNTELKQQLHSYIDAAEDEQLRAIYDLLQNSRIDPLLTTQQFIELDARMHEREAGNTKDYSWEEAVDLARKATKK